MPSAVKLCVGITWHVILTGVTYFVKTWSPSHPFSNACHSPYGVAGGSNILRGGFHSLSFIPIKPIILERI